MKKPYVFYTIADRNNEGYAAKMLNSLRKFHPDAPHVLFGQEELDKIEDDQKFYRSYARFGERLADEYELVIQIDADSIVTGDLSHILEDKEYDVAGVCNNNNVDPKITVFNVPDSHYINAGFLAVRNPRLWPWWNRLNYTPYFDQFQFREQDMLNIIVHYGDMKLKHLDYSDKWHGLIHKGLWPQFVMKGDKLVMPKTEGVCDEDKEIKIIHWAGGNVPKLNYHVSFQPEVIKRLDYLVS